MLPGPTGLLPVLEVGQLPGDAHPFDFRATRVAQAILRHSDIRTTMQVYTDLEPIDMAQAVESLPLGGSVGKTEVGREQTPPETPALQVAGRSA